MSEFEGLNTSELLQLWSRSLAELRTRGICRSANNPVADYAELLSTRALGLTLATKSNTGFDAVDGDGQRYEVKARRITPQNRSRQLSPLRGLDRHHFDFLVGVVLNTDFSVLRACVIPYARVMEYATFREHVNGWILHLRDALWEQPGVNDVTDAFAAAEVQV